MCEFVSWIQSGDRVYFLTKKELDTKKGRELRKYLGSRFHEDITGHGAIRHYFGLKDKGINKEYSNFYSPYGFPVEIQEAIKTGQFEGIGIAEDLLTASALRRYKAKRDAMYADYDAKCASLYADYDAKCAPLDADYKAKCASLYADYDAKCASLYADYDAKCDALFWSIAKVKRNRVKAWK